MSKPANSKIRYPITAADLFCGAGGTSTALLLAAQELGQDITLLAINHWDIAIDTHSLNHPYVNHICDDLEKHDPRQLVPSGKLKILVASPECTHFSNARGGEPMSKQSRATIKHVIRWCSQLKIENVLIENVKEFRTWGPLHRHHPDPKMNGRPIESRKGEYFKQFIKKMIKLGYKVEWRVLCAADYGDPTTRQRLFIIARRGDKPIHFPEPTHSPTGQQTLFGQLPRWRPARDIIDWNKKGESIFARKKPLSPNTLKRIVAGLRKFSGLPFVIGQQSGAAPRSTDEPLPTIAAAGAISLTQPFILPNEDYFRGNAPRSVDQPIPTITQRGAGALVEPYLVEYHGDTDSKKRVRSVDEPLPTQDTSNRFGLAEPYVVMFNGTKEDQLDRSNRSVDDPLPTVVAGDHLAIVEPILYVNFVCPNCQSKFVVEHDLCPTCLKVKPSPIAKPFVMANSGRQMRPRSVDEPLPTVMPDNRLNLFEPVILNIRGGDDGYTRASSIDDPLPTVTATSPTALIEPFIMAVNHGKDDQRSYSIDEPMKTITSVDAWALIESRIMHAGQGAGVHIPELGITLDIRFRMLQPHELAAAMSFPTDYQFAGNREEKVKQIGNAVPVNLAKALCKELLS